MKVIYSLEDDYDIAKIIKVSLSKVGYDVYSFGNGKDFFQAFTQKKPDLCILDLMLPDCSGMDMLKKIRSTSDNDDVKIIILSAKRMTMDKVEGLDNGADDYIEKPFDILELISRVNVRFRNEKEILIYKDLIMDVKSHSVRQNGTEVNLTNTEFEILRLLLENPSSVIKREEINERVYQSSNSVESRSIDMHIASLRKKLQDKEGHLIRTIYGVGYILG